MKKRLISKENDRVLSNKEEYCALKTSLVSEIAICSATCSVLIVLRRTLIGSEVRFWTESFLWGAPISQCQKWCLDDRIREKLFSDSDTGVEWAKLWVKSVKTLFEFAAKPFNLDEKVSWSFLTLSAKNKLDEKGTLSLISIGSHSKWMPQLASVYTQTLRINVASLLWLHWSPVYMFIFQSSKTAM